MNALNTRMAAVGLTVSAVSFTHALAVTSAVNWGGEYVNADVGWADHVPANATGSDKYGDPHGPFVIDADGDVDGADDSIVGRALDTTTPFSPTSGYSGTSSTFYGGGSVTRENSLDINGSPENDGFSELSVLNQGPNDSIHYHVDTGGDSHTFHLLTYWDKSDFLNGLDGDPNLFLGLGGFTLSTAQASGHHSDEILYWVVRDGSQFYIAENTITLTNNADFFVPYSSLTNWAPYNPVDPVGSPDAADLLSLDFDEASVFAPHTFSDVTALGWYVEHEAATGPIHVHIEAFSASASAIPEPSRVLLSFIAVFAIGLRRRR